MSESATPNLLLSGRGVDIGTAFLVSAQAIDQGGNSAVEASSVRNSFIALSGEQAPMLDISGVKYVTGREELYVVGDDAVNLAGVMGIDLRRPLAHGFISANEEDAKEIVRLILSKIITNPSKDEVAVFSVPGPLFSDGKIDKLSGAFHASFFSELINQLGFKARPINEAMAVCFSECLVATKGPDGLTIPPLTGLCFSFGSGMTNVAIVYKSILIKSFSIPLGGDYIDSSAAKATGSNVSHVTMLKEHGVDIRNGRIVDPLGSHDHHSNRQAEAIALMYKDLITKVTEAANRFFATIDNRMEIKETLPIVVSGGTSLAPGFLDVFNEVFIDNFKARFNFYDKAIHAKYPLEAVGRGCLNMARMLTKK